MFTIDGLTGNCFIPVMDCVRLHVDLNAPLERVEAKQALMSLPYFLLGPYLQLVVT